ncbi:MAG TPA: DUF6178 family protein [Syntrophales bacterium]|jgi:hypothetical protein|nr:DUF6178 family protein [Syntrophales bacterium]HQG35085.1 DUF6178 family protein [Syntrophales bacterium]HQI35983.1 DUF6178 family protein [Syntrophales bacterium]HQJ30045.1 DUF6178 family protein [Syntrophales bacterium]HRR47835.1 DUF6178 family protein [Syntrophales bacterium]
MFAHLQVKKDRTFEPFIPTAGGDDAVKQIFTLTGSTLIKAILDQDAPDVFVRNLPEGDFYWLMKQIGKEDCLPLLQLATLDQWKYILDLECWKKDRIAMDQVLEWLERLGTADAERFSSWLLGEENVLLSLLLIRTTEVIFKEDTETEALPEDYFTLDGYFFIRPLQESRRGQIERLLTILAGSDSEMYHRLLFHLAAVLPAEAEEELYRLRNVRLAEHGFLPYEEAVAIYAPLDPETLTATTPPLTPGRLAVPDAKALIPLSPLVRAGEASLFFKALSSIDDRLLQDRIRLEFAGVGNCIIAAAATDDMPDTELLTASCRRAAGYLNIALESRCGKDDRAAASVLKNHSLSTIFRVGYGHAVNLQREAKRWLAASWFVRQGREYDFWGSPWGETLAGLCHVRPLFFAGADAREPYRDFGGLEDLELARRALKQLQALDLLLSHLSPGTTNDKQTLALIKTFPPLLFNRWARKILGMDISPAPLTPGEAEKFFGILRRNDRQAPYLMNGFREIFIEDFMSGVYENALPHREHLREALELSWEMFRREYEAIPSDGLKGRYSPYLLLVGTPVP